jgi:REP element-mobilizing transposase RayT
MFWEDVGANCVRPGQKYALTQIGQTVFDEIQKLKTIYKNIAVDRFCIMPNHIHLILLILPYNSGRPQVALRYHG